MSWQILGIGVLIFLARIVDVSIGTIRTIVTVQGRTRLAFVLGFMEVTIWVTVISAIVKHIETAPVLAIFYGLGFATGNVVGILAERKLALGHVALRVFTRKAPEDLPDRVRDTGQPVTVFTGEGRSGPVRQLMMVCKRKEVAALLRLVREADPDARYLLEAVRDVGRLPPTLAAAPTGWRAVLKKK